MENLCDENMKCVPIFSILIVVCDILVMVLTQTVVLDCSVIPCSNGGICEKVDGNHTCSCQPQWKGILCEQDVDECEASPCMHGGRCRNTPGSYTCTCSAGWTGKNCTVFVGIGVTNPRPEITFYPDIEEVQNGTNQGHKDEHIIKSGTNFTVECHGDYPVKLIVKRGNHKSEAPDYGGMDIKKFPVPDSSNTGRAFGSIFVVSNTNYTYTGEYICQYTENRVQSSIYIYVTDPKHLMIKPTKRPIYLFPIFHYTPTTIRCRASDPSIDMKLLKGQNMVVKTGTENAVIYDPKEGFHLQFPDIWFSGIFSCQAKKNETTDSLQIYLIYKGGTSPPSPALLPTGDMEIAPKEDFEITCSVKVNLGSSIDMKWTYTSQERSDRVRTTIPKLVSREGPNIKYDEIYSKIIVMNARKEDEGIYTCNVTTRDDKHAAVSKWVRFVEEPFLTIHRCVIDGKNVSMEEDWVVKVTQGQDGMQVSCYFKSYPSAHVDWYHNNIRIEEDNTFYELTHLNRNRSTVHEVSLSCRLPQKERAGMYEMAISNNYFNVTKKFQVIYQYKPRVKIHVIPGRAGEKNKYFVVKEQYQFSCEVQSVPEPYFEGWQWQPCKMSSCVGGLSSWQNITSTVKRRLHFSPPASGFLRYIAKNDIGQGLTNITIKVADDPDGSGIRSLKELNPIETYPLHIQCAATKWEYNYVTMLYRKNSQHLWEEITVDNNTVIKYSRTEISYVADLIIDKVGLNDTGYYACNVMYSDKNTSKVEDFLRIRVREMQIPSFLNDKGKDAEKTNAGHTYTLRDCSAYGIPMPSITWYKDDMLLNPANNSLGIHFSQDNTSLIIRNTTLDHTGYYYCEVENLKGRVYRNWTLTITSFRVLGLSESGLQKKTLLAVIIPCVIIIIFVIVISIICFRRRSQALHKELEHTLIQPSGDYNPDLPLDEQTSCIPYDPKWEFPKKRLRQGMVLGQGAFGRVIKAEAIGIQEHEDVTIVAVKMVKDCTDRDQIMALLSELKILIHVGQHLNIVNLLGAVTKDIRYGELYVIVEYCHFGNLRSYVLKHKEDFRDVMEDYLDPVQEKKREAAREAAANKPYYINKAQIENTADLVGPALTTKNLICWSFQVARGMEYLSSRKYIHRDLAARNVLLAEDNIVKICDFGLAKDVYKNPEYHKKGDGPVPVKWMAIESLTHRLYTSKSDVWSYGIFLWELFSLGGSPYPGVEINEKFIGLLKDGYRMEKPRHSSDEMYKVMEATWKEDPDDRPTFTQLASLMGDFLEQNVKQYYLDLNEPYLKMIDLEGGACGGEPQMDGYLKMNNKKSDYLKMAPAPPPPTDGMLDSLQHKNESVPNDYVNQKKWHKEKADDVELQPLTKNIDTEEDVEVKLRRDNREQSPLHLNTRADVHRNDDTDSGHSSTYAPGTSPDIGNDGYLVPKLGPDKVAIFVQPEQKPTSKNKSNCSEFTRDYHYGSHPPPPTYSAVLQDSDTSIDV